ncbi:hypothetical protein Hanom_Chr11g01022101 [Helianthus anomalus]
MYARLDAFVAPHLATEGILHNLGVDPDEKKKKRISKKKVATAGGAAVKKTTVTDATSDVGSQNGGKPQGGTMTTTQGPGSAGSKGPDSGVAPLSDHEEETRVDPGAEKLIRNNTLKTSFVEMKFESSPVVKKVVVGNPAIGKKGDLRTCIPRSHLC